MRSSSSVSSRSHRSQEVTHPGRVELKDVVVCVGTQIPVRPRATLRAFPMLELTRQTRCQIPVGLLVSEVGPRCRVAQALVLAGRLPRVLRGRLAAAELRREQAEEQVEEQVAGQLDRSQQSCSTDKEVLSVWRLR